MTNSAALLETVKRKQETCSTGEGEAVLHCHGGPPGTWKHGTRGRDESGFNPER